MASARLIRNASTRHVPRARAPSDWIAEEEPLLPLNDDEERRTEEEARRQPRAPNPFADLPVYQNIWRIRREITQSINDPYSMEQLRAPRLNTSVVRPMVDALYEMRDISIVYCLLVNKLQFTKEQSYQAHYQSVNTSRALLCEIVALKLLRQFDEDSSGRNGLLLLCNILIAGFEPFQNAPGDLLRRSSKALKWSLQDRGGYERQMTTLEIAIVSNSKLFLSCPSCQKVIDAIYVGRVMYTPTSFIDILPDHYKHRAISLYDPRQAPRLNQYRLNVPRTRNIIEVCQFIVLLGLFFLVMETRDPSHFTWPETVFCVYAFGWILDQLASVSEHGWHVYTQNLWSFLDVTFCLIYVSYFILRMHGLNTNSVTVSQPALDILAMGAPFLIPRLAFNIFSENLLFVSLRDMMAKFVILTMLAVWSFAGFFLSMIWLSNGSHRPVTIGKWMIWVWFGLDGTGIQRSAEAHWFLGPLLMITFAILGNTLFLTILVSTLSHSFAAINRNATAEIQFRRAVLTFEGVKSDAIFSYQPPFNIIALVGLLPLKFMLDARWFHKVNITCIRVMNAPILLAISLWERRYLWPLRKGDQLKHPSKLSLGQFSRFHVHGDIQAVFDAEPPDPLPEITAASNDVDDGSAISSGSESPPPDNTEADNSGATSRKRSLRRKTSVWSADGLEARVAGLLEDHERHGGNPVMDFAERLRALEASSKRIEKLLGRVCDTMDSGNEGSATSEADEPA